MQVISFSYLNSKYWWSHTIFILIYLTHRFYTEKLAEVLDCGDEVGDWLDGFLGSSGHRLYYHHQETTQRAAQSPLQKRFQIPPSAKVQSIFFIYFFKLYETHLCKMQRLTGNTSKWYGLSTSVPRLRGRSEFTIRKTCTVWQFSTQYSCGRDQSCICGRFLECYKIRQWNGWDSYEISITIIQVFSDVFVIF